MKKYAKRALFGYITRTNSVFKESRHYRMVGANHHGHQLKGGRTMAAIRTNKYLKQTFDIDSDLRSENIFKVVQDLELIQIKMRTVPVAFVGASLLIAMDEKNPGNTEVKLIDLAHPVAKADDSRSYIKVATKFDSGISNLIHVIKDIEK
jgi:hypothetical protein